MRVGIYTIAVVAIAALGAGPTSARETHRPIATSSRACRHVAWRSLRDGNQHCPTYHSLLSDRAFARLRWSSWGGSTARGTGAFICTHRDPNYCGTTPFQTYGRVTIVLSQLTRCSNGLIYAKINVAFRDVVTQVLSHDHWSYRCHPTYSTVPSGTTGAGGG
jgi:hypothetical protein